MRTTRRVCHDWRGADTESRKNHHRQLGVVDRVFSRIPAGRGIRKNSVSTGKKSGKAPLTCFEQSYIVPPSLAATQLKQVSNKPIAPEVADVLCPPGTRCFRVFFCADARCHRIAGWPSQTVLARLPSNLCRRREQVTCQAPVGRDPPPQRRIQLKRRWQRG